MFQNVSDLVFLRIWFIGTEPLQPREKAAWLLLQLVADHHPHGAGFRCMQNARVVGLEKLLSRSQKACVSERAVCETMSVKLKVETPEV